jgi:hypothetical protein
MGVAEQKSRLAETVTRRTHAAYQTGNLPVALPAYAVGNLILERGHIPGGLLNHDPYKAFLVKTETNNCNGLSPP